LGTAYFLNLPFAQFIKGDFEYRFHQPINTTDKIAYRFYFGAAFPYGNMRVVPFEKQFFTGGANSIRAWQPYYLGPGGYNDTISKSRSFKYTTADIKIEANVEYRFKLFWKLEGAIFIDAGNIWAIKNDTRENALFKFSDFANQIAFGTGFGSRFDFTFLILRFDIGFKLKDPAEPKGYRWTFNRNVNSTFFNYNIGIGYPF
jgi:outer membrane protein assembly factor BamA